MYIIQSMVVLFLFAGLLSPALPAGGQSASPATARSGLPAEAQSASPAMDRSADQHAGYMDIDDVKPGMRGYGLTVFQDARIDTFDVEVIGVIKNQFYTDHDIIMVGVSGPYVDEAGVIAGMSGSPVYIDGKLVGALAYRFGAFPMKPIGGVTPIGHMLDIREVVETETKPGSNAPDGTPGGMGGGQNDLGPPDLGPPGFHPSGLGPSGLKPIAVPMVFSGFHPGTVSLFEDELRRRGLVPVAGGSVAGGGVALLRSQGALEGVEGSDADETIGIRIVRRAVEEPVRTIASNAGAEGSIIVEKVREAQGRNTGYNAATGEYEDMVKAGVIDPTKVTRTALQNAASIAGLLLTTEAVVVERPEAEDPAAAAGGMPGGGMGGMY